MPRTRFALTTIGLLLVVLGAVASLQRELPANPAPPPRAAAPMLASEESLRQAGELSDAFIAIASAVTPSVVRIQAERSAAGDGNWLSRGFHDFFEQPDEEAEGEDRARRAPRIAGGTGFIVSEDGYILTNNHVVSGADRITVSLSDKRAYDARLIGRDPTTDVAVIKIDASDLPAVRLGNSDRARVGEWVVAIGNPGFDRASTLDFTVTSGIISAKGRPLNILASGLRAESPDEAGYAIEDFIQTDAVINPGNSGGPLVDLDGQVIGINTAIASSTGYSQGYGFAIPSNLAREVLKDLIEHGHVRRALLGVSISDVTAEDAEVYGLHRIAGVLVEDFGADSPARHSGLERHDVIVGVDGTPVERVGQFQRLIAQREPGESVALAVVRYGEAQTYEVRLAEAPLAGPAAVADAGARGKQPAGVGLDVADLTGPAARRYGFGKAQGVVITAVTPFSAADRVRIGEGHRIVSIDRRPANSAREVRSMLRRAAPGSVVSLLMETPDGRTYIVNMRVP